jgi:creatinine amidohydrolase
MPSYGWMAGDINPDGAAGDATLSTAVKGRLTAEHQALGFIELLRDVTDFPLSDLS